MIGGVVERDDHPSPLTKLLVLLGVAVACWALAVGLVWALVELARLVW